MPGNDAYTKLLLHCDGVDGSQVFPDDSFSPPTHVITATGNTQVDTAWKVFGFGTGSVEFDGSGYLWAADHADWQLDVDSAIDFRFRLPNNLGNKALFSQYQDYQNYTHCYWQDGGGSSHQLVFQVVRNGGGLITLFYSSWEPTPYTLYHCAITHSGDTYRMFVDGVLRDTYVQAFPYPDWAGEFRIGNSPALGAVANLPAGWIDEFRVSKGDARWTANFTPPTVAYEALRLLAVNPAVGSTLGSTPVSLTGTDFVDGATVTFGGNPATSVVVVSSTRIDCVTPAGAGVVDVVVTNPNSEYATLPNAFTYVPTPFTGQLTNFATRPGIEGPQIVVTWDLPIDPGASELKIRKRRYTYPTDYTDGSEVLHDTTMTKTSVVDYGILTNVIWCYQGFTKYTCTVPWADTTSYVVGDRIIPIIPNGYFYECTTAGTSDSGEPTWPTTIGDTIDDDTVVWETKNINPGWETGGITSRASDFTWDSEYMTHVLFGLLPSLYRSKDAETDQVALTVETDSDDDGERRAYHEDGAVERGQLERFLMIFGSVASRIKGAIDFMAQLINPDECPPKYLPRLASVLGVTIDGTLPVDAQRATIRNAVAVHRQSGTESGLERALRSAVDVANVNVDPMAKHVLVSNRAAKQSVVFAGKWETGAPYILGAVIAPSDTFGALGRVFECTTAGTSGGTEPQWVPAWAITTYSVGDVIVPTSVNGWAYVCTAAGTSGGTEPTWPANLDDTVTDGTVTWRTGNPPAAGIGTTFNDGPVVWTTVIDESIYDWADSGAGHSWELPTFDSYGRVTAEAALYSFEILRLWFILTGDEEITSEDTERIARVMSEFAPVDTRYVIRVEGP